VAPPCSQRRVTAGFTRRASWAWREDASAPSNGANGAKNPSSSFGGVFDGFDAMLFELGD
jgi:hypothetical protein